MFNRAEGHIIRQSKYEGMEHEYRTSHLDRIKAERKESLATHEIHMEVMDHLKQINVYVIEIAKSVVKFAES